MLVVNKKMRASSSQVVFALNGFRQKGIDDGNYFSEPTPRPIGTTINPYNTLIRKGFACCVAVTFGLIMLSSWNS